MTGHIPDGIQHFPGVTAKLEAHPRDKSMMLIISVQAQENPGLCGECQEECQHTRPMLFADRWLRSNGWTMRSGSASHSGLETRRYRPPGQEPAQTGAESPEAEPKPVNEQGQAPLWDNTSAI